MKTKNKSKQKVQSQIQIGEHASSENKIKKLEKTPDKPNAMSSFC